MLAIHFDEESERHDAIKCVFSHAAERTNDEKSEKFKGKKASILE